MRTGIVKGKSLKRRTREKARVEVGRAVDPEVGVFVGVAGQLRRGGEEHRQVLDAAARPSLDQGVSMGVS